jgi:hypothetical protein
MLMHEHAHVYIKIPVPKSGIMLIRRCQCSLVHIRDTFAFITLELALTKASGTTRQHQRIQTCADCNATRVLTFPHKAASSN